MPLGIFYMKFNDIAPQTYLQDNEAEEQEEEENEKRKCFTLDKKLRIVCC